MDNFLSLPAAIGVSRLSVYTTPGPDGLAGGGPHVHLACSEAYAVLAGRGTVQTLGPEGYYEINLEPGGLVWFTPGLIHRLINLDGALEILVIMQNAGLPEAGDFVLTLPPALLTSAERYRRAAALPPSGTAYADTAAAARQRRDLAVEGFLALREQVEKHGPDALAPFYRAATALAQPRVKHWRTLWEYGPLVATLNTREQLDAIEAGNGDHLRQGRFAAAPPPGDARRWGVCGRLGVYQPEGSASL